MKCRKNYSIFSSRILISIDEDAFIYFNDGSTGMSLTCYRSCEDEDIFRFLLQVAHLGLRQ